jgi:ABC-type lipoprotein release transport system permease subunit
MSIMVDDYSEVGPVMQKLEDILPDTYEAMSWDEMQPELVQMIESDRAGGIIMKAILYMVIGFGILGTILMMMAERRKEMGIMVGVGMKKRKLAGILFFELIYMGFLGVVAGILVSMPIIAVAINNPIPITGDAAQAILDMGIEPRLVFSAIPSVFYNQVITVFVIVMGISLYPAVKVLGMKEIKYLRD